MSTQQELAVSGPSDPKRPRMDIQWDLCMICQKDDKSRVLLENPTAYEQVLTSIHARGKYGDGIYPELSRMLDEVSSSFLREKGATWHRECYRSTTSRMHIARAKARYEKQISIRAGPSYVSEAPVPSRTPILTRRSIAPYDKELCFFCQKESTRKYPLFKVATDSVGKKLCEAVKISKNEIFKVRMSTAINPEDAHAIDVRYHKHCFAKHVTNSLRVHAESQSSSISKSVESQLAAEVEFLGELNKSLQKGIVLSVSELVEKFRAIRESNGVENPEISKFKLKQFLTDNVDDIQFSKPVRLNESERVTLKITTDKAIQEFQEKQTEPDMQNMFNVATHLRKQMLDVESWRFSGSLNTGGLSGKHVPRALIIFLRWLIQGPSKLSSEDENVDEQVHKRALTLAQHAMYACLTRKQLSGNKKSLSLKHNSEWPLQLSVGLTVHSTFRSKELIDFLHGLCFSVDYRRIISVETQLANQAITSMCENEGAFIPRNFAPGRHIFFAVDNCDFQEDTVDGKNTLHGTVMNIYQRVDENDVATDFEFDANTEDRRLYDLPQTITEIEECTLSNNAKPECREFSVFPSYEDMPWNMRDISWLFAASTGLAVVTEPDPGQDLVGPPTWSAFNSILSEPLPLTRVATPPLIAAPAHEFSTLLTVLKQAQKISTIVVGEEHKTVVSLDMGLYKPAQKLLMAKKGEMENIVLRPGELHIVIAMLRTIGCFIDSSGIDAAWLHADLYGQTTIKQILDGNHVKRGIKAHTVTLLSLFALNMQSFSKQNSTILDECKTEFSAFNEQCKNLSSLEQIVKGCGVIEQFIESSDFVAAFNRHNTEGNHMHQAMMVYMRMVMLMLNFIRAVRNGDWGLHLHVLGEFVKYFFAFDKINYARMIPLYLLEMNAIQLKDPDLWNEFASGNWVVNKSKVAFCALGADHALEQVNRWMKVAGGLVGITQNQTARARFFLVAPEMARLKEESKHNANVEKKFSTKHYELSNAARSKLIMSAVSLTKTLQSFTNPFEYEGEDIINIVSGAVVAEDIQKDIEKIEQVGIEKRDEFVEARLKNKTISFWDSMKKVSVKTWKSCLKESKLKVGDKTVELKEDRGLFARMLIVANSRPEISLEETIGTYELSVVPRALFGPDGTMNHCSDKSQLMTILEKETDQSTLKGDTTVQSLQANRVAIVDAMVVVQGLDKPASIKTFKDLSDHFCRRVTEKFDRYMEVHLIFDRYDVERSLKTETRSRRLGNKQSITYHVADSGRIDNVSMKTLLSSTTTKDELSAYLSANLLEFAKETNKQYVIAFRNQVISTAGSKEYLASSQEEADTKIILHAADAHQRGVTKIDIHSADTDVLILCLGHFDKFPEDTLFVTGSGQRKRNINLAPICESLGVLKWKALIGFHAFSGADITGSMSGKGKISCWHAFNNAEPHIHKAFADLGHTSLADSTKTALEHYVCTLYQPGTDIRRLNELRWWMFRRKQAESNKLPPTQGAFLESVKRSQYQCIVWQAATETNPDMPLPENFGWRRDGDIYAPVMTTMPPAPETLLQLVKCGCSKSACNSSRCKCRANKLNCTDLCNCGAEDESCKNLASEQFYDDF